MTKGKDTLKLVFSTKQILFVLVPLFVVWTLGIVQMLVVPLDKDIDPEYINGMLTASSILFGFLILLAQTRIRGRFGALYFEQVTMVFVFGSIFLLSIAVLFVYLAGLGLVPSVRALSFTFSTFVVISGLIGLDLYVRSRWREFEKKIA